MLPVSAVGLGSGWLQVFLRVPAEFGCAVRTAEIIGLSAALDRGSRRLGVNLHAADWIRDCCGVLHGRSVLVCGGVLFEPEFLGSLAAIGRGLDGDEVHATFGAFAGLVGDDVGVHEAGIELSLIHI